MTQSPNAGWPVGRQLLQDVYPGVGSKWIARRRNAPSGMALPSSEAGPGCPSLLRAWRCRRQSNRHRVRLAKSSAPPHTAGHWPRDEAPLAPGAVSHLRTLLGRAGLGGPGGRTSVQGPCCIHGHNHRPTNLFCDFTEKPYVSILFLWPPKRLCHRNPSLKSQR